MRSALKVSGINTPWHAPDPWDFTGISSDYQDLGMQAKNGRFRAGYIREGLGLTSLRSGHGLPGDVVCWAHERSVIATIHSWVNRVIPCQIILAETLVLGQNDARRRKP